MVFSKKMLFSHSVSSASISNVCRAIRNSALLYSHALQRELFTTPKLSARPSPAGPESPLPVSAPRQTASNNPGIRGSDPTRSSRPASSAESCRANAPDAAAPHHRAIRPAPLSDRSDTCALPVKSGKKRFYSVLRIASGGGGKKFVAVYPRGDSAALVLRFHAQHARVTADVHVARERDLLRQGQN